MRHPIQGQVESRFEAVRQTFSDNFALRGELGASFCVYYQGKKVVDLWGGYTDLKASRDWQANDMTTLFSVTKGIVATCFLMLVDRGQIKYQDQIAHYWPELTQGSASEQWIEQRQDLTIADLLNHRSGFLGFKESLTIQDLADESLLLSRLEQEPLRWKPGSRQGYHGISYGLYAGALFKKITGQSLGAFLRTEIKPKLASSDLYLGLTTLEEQTLSSQIQSIFPSQTGDILTGILPSLLYLNREGRFYRSVLKASSDTQFAFAQPAELGARGLKNFNLAKVRALELPWANALGSARGIAGLYQALLRPGLLVKPDTLALVTPRQSWTECDAVLRKPMGFSYGFVKEETQLFSPHTESFGHPGAGGALGWADPKSQLSMGYVMNRMGYQVRSPRALALCHAVYRCIR